MTLAEDMRQWTEQALSHCHLHPDHRGYLLGRGAFPSSIVSLALTSWRVPEVAAPDPDFRERYGTYGEFFENRLIIPLYTPRGHLAGWDSRRAPEKGASRYTFPNTKWNPIFLGLPTEMPKIWKGSPVWLCEGIFDMFALQQLFGLEDGFTSLKGPAILGIARAKLDFSQINFIHRFVKEAAFALDMDKTGREASESALRSLNYLGVECRDIPYRGGKDPGEIWDRGGRQALLQGFSFQIRSFR